MGSLNEDFTSFTVKSPDNEDITFQIQADGRLSVVFGYSDPATIIYATSNSNSSIWWRICEHFSITILMFFFAMGAIVGGLLMHCMKYRYKCRQRSLNAQNIKYKLPCDAVQIETIEVTDVSHVYV